MNKGKGKLFVKKYFDANNSFNDKSLSLILHSDILYENIINWKETIKINGIDKLLNFTSKKKKYYFRNRQLRILYGKMIVYV